MLTFEQNGASGETRTHNQRPGNFESPVYTDSTTLATILNLRSEIDFR